MRSPKNCIIAGKEDERTETSDHIKRANQKRYHSSSEHTTIGFANEVDNINPATKKRATTAADLKNTCNYQRIQEPFYPNNDDDSNARHICQSRSELNVDNQLNQEKLSSLLVSQVNQYNGLLLCNPGHRSVDPASWQHPQQQQMDRAVLAQSLNVAYASTRFSSPHLPPSSQSLPVATMLPYNGLPSNRTSCSHETIPAWNASSTEASIIPAPYSEYLVTGNDTVNTASRATLLDAQTSLVSLHGRLLTGYANDPPQQPTAAASALEAACFPLSNALVPHLALLSSIVHPGTVELARHIAQRSIATILEMTTPIENAAIVALLGNDCPASTASSNLFVPCTPSVHQVNNVSERFEYQNTSTPCTSNRMEMGLSLACWEDRGMLNEYLVLLRKQIEFFQATDDDVLSHTRGRNKAVTLQQVGIRCIHCSHIPVGNRRKGSTYFPSTLMGIYQAAQNIGVQHLQSGSCPEMPDDVKRTLMESRAVKRAASGVGKAYWADSAQRLALIDTDDGIRFSQMVVS